MKFNVRTQAATLIAALYLVVAIGIRWLVPLDSTAYGVLVYTVPLIALVAIALAWPRGAQVGEIRVSPPPGALGDSTIEQQLEDVRALLEDVRARQINDTRVSQEIEQLNKLIRAVKGSSVRSQLLSFALGIVATLLLSGVPGPFAVFFPHPC
jgi:hypothetical protein